MNQEQLAPSLRHLVEQLSHIPGVLAVSLGGSRARGQARPDSDWDFGLYYRRHINADDLRSLGYPGYIVEPGAWGRLVNGGGWLMIDEQRVDVLYRDLDVVEYWTEEAQQGRFEVDNVAGHIVGLPTYVLAGELAMGKVLYGQLPRPSFPEMLCRTAPPRWEAHAAFSLLYADGYAARNEVVACAGSLARAVLAVAHARLAQRSIWVLNEKRMVQLADLTKADEILARIGHGPEELKETTAQIRRLLGLARPQGMKADEVVKTSE